MSWPGRGCLGSPGSWKGGTTGNCQKFAVQNRGGGGGGAEGTENEKVGVVRQTGDMEETWRIS